MPTEGEVIAHRFRLIHELGRGGMGTVWLAWHLTLEVPCAVKFIISERNHDTGHRARFGVEARATAQLHGPNVVRILDHSPADDEAPYIAMEFLDGEDLRARLGRVGRLTPRATYGVVAQVARGLTQAHAAGIIHRDLKPENIFFAREGGEEVVKILDFGIAKWQARSPVREEGLIGTVEYMSPEVARSAAAGDHRADLWALSVITFECLTGLMPFRGESLDVILAAVRSGVVPVPSEIAPELGAGFDTWWARATSTSIDARFASAQELVGALGPALGLAEPTGDELSVLAAPPKSDPPARAAETPSVVPVERSATPDDRPALRRRRARRSRVLAAALLSVMVAAPFGARVATRHYGALLARSPFELPHLAPAESMPVPDRLPPLLLAPVRIAPRAAATETVAAAAPPSASVARAPETPARAMVATRAMTPKPPRLTARPIMPLPEPASAGPASDDPPRQSAPPKNEEAVVDFGI